MVDEKHRGSTIALQMYKEVMRFVLENQIELVMLDCEPENLNSYLKLDFHPFGARYHYPGIGEVIPMALITGDYDHLKRVGSPFSALLTKEDLSYCCFVSNLRAVLNQESNRFLGQYNYELDYYSEFLKSRHQII